MCVTYATRVKKNLTDVNLILSGATVGVWKLSFNLPHFMLADKYQEIAKRVPRIIKEEQDEEETKC